MQQTLASPGGGRVLTAQSPADRLYKVMRVLVVVLVFFLFIPSLNPARITELIAVPSITKGKPSAMIRP